MACIPLQVWPPYYSSSGSLVYRECKPVPGVAMLGKLYQLGPVGQLWLMYNLYATTSYYHRQARSIPCWCLDHAYQGYSVDAAGGVLVKKEGLEMKTYSNLVELLKESLTSKKSAAD